MNSENDDSKDLSKADTSGFSPFHNRSRTGVSSSCCCGAMALLLGKLVLMGVTSGKNSNIAELLPGSLSLGFKGETSKHSG